MGKKIDRTFELVVGETSSEPEKERFAGGRAALSGALLLAVSMVAWQWIGTWAALGLGVGLFLMRASFVHAPRKSKPVTRAARVEISEEGIKPVGARMVPRAEIAQAYFQPRGEERPTVKCVDRAHRVIFEAEVEDEDEAEEILAALGQDASHARSVFRVAAPHFNGAFGAAASMLLSLGLLLLAGAASGSAKGGWAVTSAMLGALVVFVTSLNIQQRVEVGVDGVLVTWLWRKRFLPFAELESVAVAHGKRVELRLRGGEVVNLWSRRSAQDLGALAARIQEASRAHARSASARELAAAVARGERGVAEWRAELERLHDPETRGGYRTPGARGEDLWRVVEDTTAPEDARAGAAMALRKEDGAHPRLRVAAEAIASPKLRIALERAADPHAEESALDEALEAFAAEATQEER